jgi:hypothetical protein
MTLLVGASVLAALLTCLDTALKSEEPLFALRTKEWWFLFLYPFTSYERTLATNPAKPCSPITPPPITPEGCEP